MVSKNSFSGCFLGLALGDALCAPYEGGILERGLWRLIGKTRSGKKRYTDDTQMSLDIAESFCENQCINQDHLAGIFASNYRWSRGYGAGAAKILKNIKKGARWQDTNRLIYPEGSYGNGAAMRAPVAALCFYGNDVSIIHAVKKISEITHTHPLAIEGANLIALSVSFALSQSNFDELFAKLLAGSELREFQVRLEIAREWIENRKEVACNTVIKELGNGVAAVDSCVTAIYIASRYIDEPFADMLGFIVKCSGDTDTIGAMAGAIWGAYNGINRLSRSDIEDLESASRIEQLSLELFNRYGEIY